jgi:hypothetical protein
VQVAAELGVLEQPILVQTVVLAVQVHHLVYPGPL